MDAWDPVDAGGTTTDWLAMPSLMAPVAVGVSIVDSGVFVAVNDAFSRLVRRPRERIVGRTAADLGLWPDVQQHQRLVEMLQRHGSVTRFETQYRDSLGETGDVEVSGRIVRRDGQSYLISFLAEVSDRREFVDGLRTAQARLDLVLRSSRMLVFRQDADLRYTWVANPALGATEADLVGRTDDDIMGAEAAAPLVAIKRRVLQTGRAERRDVWVAHNGQLGCFDLVVEPERDATGRLVGLICAAQDITWRMTANPAANPAASTAPVVAIRGMASLIGREALTRRQAERLQRIDRTAERMAEGTVGREDPSPAQQRLRDRHAGTLVLVAEHNPVLRELLRALLEQAGLRVALAASGVEAFSFTMQLKPALLLLDMELPQAGGVAAARAVRTMAAPALPIVAMLSDAAPAGNARALDADLDDVLGKPVAATQLYEKVLAWLEARR